VRVIYSHDRSALQQDERLARLIFGDERVDRELRSE
jgi:hypothetical protein